MCLRETNTRTGDYFRVFRQFYGKPGFNFGNFGLCEGSIFSYHFFGRGGGPRACYLWVNDHISYFCISYSNPLFCIYFPFPFLNCLYSFLMHVNSISGVTGAQFSKVQIQIFLWTELMQRCICQHFQACLAF